MSNETKQALDLFCEVNGMSQEQRKSIVQLMHMSYLEGSIAVRDEWINTTTNNYGNTIRHNSGAAQN